jgi:hypothetical protein
MDTIGRMSAVDHHGQIDGRAIARWRLRTQRLSGPERYASAPAVVQGLLGVQAENHAQAAWAVATRTRDPDKAAFDRLFDEGAFLRTHVLRPTWHFVRPADIRWLVELTAARIRGSLRFQQRALGIGSDDLERARQAITDALAGGRQLTRDGLAPFLQDAGLGADGPQLALFTADAEAEALICSGAMVQGKHTYALLESRAPHARRLGREDALAEIALRYFRGHGPATERDLSYWAQLTLTDVRRGLGQVADELDSFEHDGRRYWHGGDRPPDEPAEPAGHMLQILDELYRGYERGSREHLDVAGLHQPGRLTSMGMALVDGQMVGDVQRCVRPRRVSFALRPFRALADSELAALQAAAERYGRFLGLEPELELAEGGRA